MVSIPKFKLIYFGGHMSEAERSYSMFKAIREFINNFDTAILVARGLLDKGAKDTSDKIKRTEKRRKINAFIDYLIDSSDNFMKIIEANFDDIIGAPRLSEVFVKYAGCAADFISRKIKEPGVIDACMKLDNAIKSCSAIMNQATDLGGLHVSQDTMFCNPKDFVKTVLRNAEISTLYSEKKKIDEKFNDLFKELFFRCRGISDPDKLLKTKEEFDREFAAALKDLQERKAELEAKSKKLGIRF
jgi:hypothetical protein